MQLTYFEIHTAHFKDFTGREAIYYSLKFKYFSCNLVLLFSTCNTSNQLQLHQLQFTTLATQTTSEAASEIYKYAPLAILICCTVSNPTLHARLPSIKYIRFSVESAVHWPATGLQLKCSTLALRSCKLQVDKYQVAILCSSKHQLLLYNICNCIVRHQWM